MKYFGIIRELDYTTYKFKTLGFGFFEVFGTYADGRRCYFRTDDAGEPVKQATYTRQTVTENGKKYNVFYIEAFDRYPEYEGLNLTLDEYKAQLKDSITVENVQRFFK